jgi:hypothetical protein
LTVFGPGFGTTGFLLAVRDGVDLLFDFTETIFLAIVVVGSIFILVNKYLKFYKKLLNTL